VPGGANCSKTAEQCIILNGSGDCYRGSPSGCLTDEACQAQWHEACVGE
jgi:hypothetical protein